MCTLSSQVGEESVESSKVVVLRREEWGKTGQGRTGMVGMMMVVVVGFCL